MFSARHGASRFLFLIPFPSGPLVSRAATRLNQCKREQQRFGTWTVSCQLVNRWEETQKRCAEVGQTATAEFLAALGGLSKACRGCKALRKLQFSLQDQTFIFSKSYSL